MKSKEKKMVQTMKAGFTLIEVILVVVIIGIIASIGIPKIAGKTERAKLSKAAATIKIYESAISIYEMEKGAYPSSLADLQQKADDGAPYMEHLLKDPWDQPFSYSHPGSNNKYSFDLSTTSPNGKTVKNWED